METILNEREAEYVKALMKWDRLRMKLGWAFMSTLAIGGTIFVLSALAMARTMNDHTAHSLTLPGFALGLILIVASFGGVFWVQRRHLIVSILNKLQQPRQSD